jgi:hypothetical protein
MSGKRETMVIKMEIIESVTTAQGKLTYQLIKSVRMGLSVYGIKITNDLFAHSEECLVSDVTCDEKAGRRLLNLCIENTVLPVTLQNICEDFIISDELSA